MIDNGNGAFKVNAPVMDEMFRKSLIFLSKGGARSGYTLSCGHKEHTLISSASSNDSLSSFEVNGSQSLDYEPFITLFDALQESSHGRVFEVEVSQLFVHLAIGNVGHSVVQFLTVHVKIQGLHGVTSGYLHDFEHLEAQNR